MSLLPNSDLFAIELDCNEIKGLDFLELGLLCCGCFLTRALFDVCFDNRAFFTGDEDGCDVRDAFLFGFARSQLGRAEDGRVD